MRNISVNSIFFCIAILLITSSCGSENKSIISQPSPLINNYSSESKDQFVNNVLLKKCSSFKKRDMKRYSTCIKETKISLDSINWSLLDSLKENQKNNIFLPCNSLKIRSPGNFSLCVNRQLNGFENLPGSIKEDLNIAQKNRKQDKSPNKDNWNNIFDGFNSNNSLLSGEEVFEMFEKSVFMIFATNQAKEFSTQGSAVAVSGDMLFTNCHVVLDDRNNPHEIIAFANDSVDETSWFNAVIFKMSPSTDQCILKSTQKKNLQYIPIGRKNFDLRVGEQVLALGYPKASDLNFDSKYRAPLTLSKGIVSAIREKDNVTQIQTDAFIINGSSGGALLDMKGNLIGITTSGLEGTQLNFAISADEFENL